MSSSSEQRVQLMPDDAGGLPRALTVLVIAVAYACLNLYLSHLALDSMVDLSGEFRGYAQAGFAMRFIISAADSTAVRIGVLPGLAWTASTMTLWRSHGPRAAAGLATVLTVLACLGSFYIAGALWGS